MMKKELDTFCSFWSSLLDVSQEQKQAFYQALEAAMVARCANHWYPQTPIRGQALRSVIYDPSKADIDPLLIEAIQSIGIDADQLPKLLVIPKGAKFCQIWTDPGLVEVSYGPSASSVLYRQQQLTASAPAFNPYGMVPTYL
jgi:hypothetical protein